MVFCLADNVQVRKESWGLLFYAQIQHRLLFVKSHDWLYPHYFDGTWTFDHIVEDVASRTENSDHLIEKNLQKLTDHLLKNGMVVHELC
jgi:putative mycofactocin binding protein MftB